MKAIITKYALTSGVQVLDGEFSDISLAFVHRQPGTAVLWYFRGSDWHTDKETAATQVSKMLEKRRAYLEKQLAALDKRASKAMQAIETADLASTL